jgi:transposase
LSSAAVQILWLGLPAHPLSPSASVDLAHLRPIRGRIGRATRVTSSEPEALLSHLCRDFQAMIDRKNGGSPFGERPLDRSDRLFHHWHRVREGTLDRAGFASRAARLRRQIKQARSDGASGPCATTATTCRELLRLEPFLWTFVTMPGVEPTNNQAERERRHAVLLRKISGGTDSEVGSRFVERLLTARATCRLQGVGLLD